MIEATLDVPEAAGMNEFLIADLFCGAGGSSTGAELAVKEIGGEMLLVCVNHWPVAIETHQRNHPTARHYIEDVMVADPERIVPEGQLDLLMASPECRYYSRARGGKPVHDQGRMNPWAIHRWLTSLDVRSLLVENVQEFTEWGPLLPSGRLDPKKKGVYFEAWVKALWELGYATEWRMLNAADYGDATTRTRFFLQARKDGQPIRWPQPTHAPISTAGLFGQKPRWRAAREIIDWANPGRSLLDDPKYRKRPLSEKTRRRIARGLERFGGPLAPLYISLLGLEPEGTPANGDPQGFIMGKQSSPSYRDLDSPIPTVTTDGTSVLVQPVAEPFILGQQSAAAPRSTDNPIPTVAGAGAISLVQPFLARYNGAENSSSVGDIDKPVPTLTAKDRFGLARPVIVPYRGERAGQEPRAHCVDEPLPTVTTEPAFGLAQPVLVDVNHGENGNGSRAHDVDSPLSTVTTRRGTGLAVPFMVQWDQHGGNGAAVRDVGQPLPTIVTKQNTGLVEPVIVQAAISHQAGKGVRSVDEPLFTITTGARLGLAEPALKLLEDGDIDPRRLVLVDGQPYILDIRFRMLSNTELARAMGFEDEESRYEFLGNQGEVTKQIGNAVPVHLAAALVGAILKEQQS